jgi:hypothetical protein
MTEEQLNNLLDQLAGEAGSGVTIQMTGSAAALLLKALLGKGCDNPKQEAPESEERYVNVDEAMDIVNVSGNTLYAWGRKGYVSTKKFGKRVFFKYSDLVRIRDERRRKS